MIKQKKIDVSETLRDMETFKLILGLTQKELKDTLVKDILPLFYNKEMIKSKDGYIKVVGEEDVMLLAHMDTVFKKPPTMFIFDKKQELITSPDGLGGDDRCGIFSILALLLAGHRPHILFTEDEEIGGVGARKASKEEIIPTDVKYLIQLDRRGSEDAVFYCCDNPKFHSFIEEYGFKKARGSFTDIDTLMPIWDICGVNLSIGYYNEHREYEYVDIKEMIATVEKVSKMISTLPEEKPAFIEKTYVYYKKKNKTIDFYQGMYQQESKEDGFDIVCYACGKFHNDTISKSVYGMDLCDGCHGLLEIPS
jgi:hypothetical protein